MKKNSLFDKLLYFINSVFATVLLISYFLPYIEPNGMPSISILSLLVPFLILINAAFFVYWLIKLKKNALLSGIILGIGLVFSTPLYKFSEKKVLLNNDLKVMSYNVRLFNYFGWNKDEKTANNIVDFIHKKDADILSIQEFSAHKDVKINYPYKYIKKKRKNFGLAIFSKFPIINSGSLDLKKTSNNIIFADIVREKDTIRVYNIHLESTGLKTDKENFGKSDSNHLINTISYAFTKQATQIKEFIAHQESWKGKKIICGDFNNTAYSWAYKQISENTKDAFIEAGQGFGKSYNYTFPVRIDYILTDKTATINNFKTFDIKYSDHFPIMAKMNWNN